MVHWIAFFPNELSNFESRVDFTEEFILVLVIIDLIPQKNSLILDRHSGIDMVR